jgi:hypothetical protein
MVQYLKIKRDRNSLHVLINASAVHDATLHRLDGGRTSVRPSPISDRIV